MTEFQRFAVYYAPPPGSALATAGAAWLGWDAEGARARPHPDLGLDLARMTATPRKYGLHGTLKPPMRLTCPPDRFFGAVETLAEGLAPIDMGRLCLRSLGGFLALVPEAQPQALRDAAARIVEDLDPFRAELTEDELARRRQSGLTAQQEQLLQRWGYPFVMDEFRFHVTLTGRLDARTMTDALRAAYAWFDPALAERQMLDALNIFGEDTDGRFHLITRVPLHG